MASCLPRPSAVCLLAQVSSNVRTRQRCASNRLPCRFPVRQPRTAPSATRVGFLSAGTSVPMRVAAPRSKPSSLLSTAAFQQFQPSGCRACGSAGLGANPVATVTINTLAAYDPACWSRRLGGAVGCSCCISHTCFRRPASFQRGLTPRSTRGPAAGHLAREALLVILRLAGQASHRWPRVTSNVRPHSQGPFC